MLHRLALVSPKSNGNTLEIMAATWNRIRMHLFIEAGVGGVGGFAYLVSSFTDPLTPGKASVHVISSAYTVTCL